MYTSFFFDTADAEYITQIWHWLKELDFTGREVIGITTNPKALFKVGKHDVVSIGKCVRELCGLVSRIRNDELGVVYVQLPFSEMKPEQAVRFAKFISQYTDGKTRVGLKIPPFKEILDVTPQLASFTEINVTGVADCATGMHADSYIDVSYVSMIPGRMEERGLDAKKHVQYFLQRAIRSHMIAGSMRTLEGLKWTVGCGAIPTIGSAVWESAMAEPDVFMDVWAQTPITPEIQKFAPPAPPDHMKLSEEFFEEMDKYANAFYYSVLPYLNQIEPIL